MMELKVGNSNDLAAKVRDLVEQVKRHERDKRLIQNLKMLMRDFKTEGPLIIGELSDYSRQNLLSLSQNDISKGE